MRRIDYIPIVLAIYEASVPVHRRRPITFYVKRLPRWKKFLFVLLWTVWWFDHYLSKIT